jgi:hypothetical protein
MSSRAAQATGLTGAVFHVLDQVDVAAGAWLVLALVVPPTPALVLASLAFVFVAAPGDHPWPATRWGCGPPGADGPLARE